MKFGSLAAMIFLIAGCAVQQKPRPQESKSVNTLSRDSYDCERQAALAGVGGRAKAFDDCMRARGRTPGP
jgi:Flp pilus assembly protein TadD